MGQIYSILKNYCCNSFVKCFYICYFYTLSMEKTLVIIPTYNEIENIEAIVNVVFQSALKTDVLVVDDQSPDGTGAVVKKLMQNYPEKLFLETRAQKEGLGAAYVHGFFGH